MDQVQESYDEFNLNFRIEDTVIVNQTEMEGFNAFFLGNQSTCQQSVVEGVRVLSYKIPATLPLGQFLKKQLYKGEFLSILSNILNQLLYFEDRNMPIKKVLLNTKYMYIELSNLHVQLIYMPIEKDFADCNVLSITNYMQMCNRNVTIWKQVCIIHNFPNLSSFWVLLPGRKQSPHMAEMFLM